MSEENTNTAPSTETTGAPTTTAESAVNTEIKTPSTSGSTSINFLESISDDIKNEPSLSNIKDINSLAKGYVSAQRMLGNSIRIPGPDASPEIKSDFYKKLTSIPGVVLMPDDKDEKSVGEFYSKLGRPQTPDGYNLNVPEPIQRDEHAMKEVADFKQFAHKLGLNTKQASELVGYQINKAQTEVQQKTAELQQAETFLKQTWGQEFNNKIAVSKDLLSHYETKYPDAVADLRYGDAGRNPVFIMMAAELGRLYKESGAIQGGSSLGSGLTPEEARSRILEMQSNKSHALHDPMAPGHKEAVEKMQGYYRAIYGDGPVGG